MTKEELNNKLWEAAKEGDYIDFRDDAFKVVNEETNKTENTFSHLDDLHKYLEDDNKIIKSIKCINGVNTEKRHTTYNLFVLWVIEARYTFNELLELGYNFKEINKILKQQEER